MAAPTTMPARPTPLRIITLLALTMVTSAPSSAASLLGPWGGQGIRLTVAADGARIEYECGAGTIAGTLQADAHGHFQAQGTHESYAPGPTPATPAAARSASYAGEVTGDRMLLTVTPAGDAAPRRYELVRGRNVKLVRCL